MKIANRIIGCTLSLLMFLGACNHSPNIIEIGDTTPPAPVPSNVPLNSPLYEEKPMPTDYAESVEETPFIAPPITPSFENSQNFGTEFRDTIPFNPYEAILAGVTPGQEFSIDEIVALFGEPILVKRNENYILETQYTIYHFNWGKLSFEDIYYFEEIGSDNLDTSEKTECLVTITIDNSMFILPRHAQIGDSYLNVLEKYPRPDKLPMTNSYGNLYNLGDQFYGTIEFDNDGNVSHIKYYTGLFSEYPFDGNGIEITYIVRDGVVIEAILSGSL